MQTDRNAALVPSGTLWQLIGTSSVTVVATNLGRPRGLAGEARYSAECLPSSFAELSSLSRPR